MCGGTAASHPLLPFWRWDFDTRSRLQDDQDSSLITFRNKPAEVYDYIHGKLSTSLERIDKALNQKWAQIESQCGSFSHPLSSTSRSTICASLIHPIRYRKRELPCDCVPCVFWYSIPWYQFCLFGREYQSILYHETYHVILCKITW